MFLDVDVSELKTIHSAAKKLIGKNTGVPNSILLESAPNKLTAKIVTGGNWLCYEAKLRGNSKGEGAFLIPLDKLETLSNSPAKSKISFTGESPEQLTVVVDSGNFSRQYRLDCPSIEEFPPMNIPAFAEINGDTFLRHLDTALECTTNRASVYTLNTVEIDGDKGRVVGCDGKRLFVGNSLTFPFTGKRYLNADATLKSKSIRKEGPVAMAVEGSRLFLRVGQWTISQFVEGTHYPHIDTAIPAEKHLRTSFTITDAQAKQIMDALETLPGKDSDNGYVQLSVNDKLVLSGADEESQQVSSITIDATVTGEPKVTAFNRTFFIQAIEAGFRQFQVSHENGAVYGIREDARYLFMAIRPTNDEEQKQETPRAEAGQAQAKGDANHAATASHVSASAISNTATNQSARAGRAMSGDVNAETTTHVTVPASSVSQTETSTSNRKELTMENQGTTAVVNPPASQSTGTAAQTGQSTHPGEKPAPVSGFHQPPVAGIQQASNEVTADTINQQIGAAKDAIRTANNALYELQATVKEFVKQTKDREKQNTAAIRALDNIKKLAAA